MEQKPNSKKVLDDFKKVVENKEPVKKNTEYMDLTNPINRALIINTQTRG